jgi:ribosomal protein S2
MVVALPIAKLSSLLIKTLAKPMAKRVKTTFKQYEFLKAVLVSTGQFTNRVTTRMTIWSEGYKVRSIQPLEKEAALSAGADFIGEAFIFSVGGSLVVWEYNKSKEKDRVKDENNVERERMQEQRLVDLQSRMESLEQSVNGMIQMERQRQMHAGLVFEPEIIKRRGWRW